MKSTINTLKILELIATYQPLGVNDLVKQLEQPKTNVQRALTTLSKAGWIRKAYGESTGWVLTSKLFVLANKSSALADLNSVALPYVRDLHKQTKETVFASYLEATQMTVFDVIQGTKDSLAVVSNTGDAYALHVSAPGKACMALMEDKKLGDSLEELKAFADNPPQIHDLLEDLKATKKRGYAIVRGDVSSEVVTVGACFVDSLNKPLGGLGVSIPASRASEKMIKELGLKLKLAAKRIGETLQ